MKTYIVDTNIILRFLLADIPDQYKQVKQMFLKAKKEEITLIVPQIVIFEINFVKVKHNSTYSTQYLHIESKNIFEKALYYYKNSNGLSLVDCFLLGKSEDEEAELFTFDDKLKTVKI